MGHSRPDTGNDNRRKLPYGVGILVIIQILFFFTVQFDNYRYRQMAIDFYFDAGLSKTEFPLYTRYLQKYMANDIFYNRLEIISSGNMPNIELYWLIRYDPFFQHSLDTNAMPENTLYYVNWQQKRSEYKRLLNKDIVQSFSFTSAKASVTGVLVSLFSTENTIQFIVNTMFLIIVGLLLETRIRMIWLLGSYMLGGILMISCYCLIAPISLVPVAATNGGIMGLLGLLTILYGLKKEKINYYNGKTMSSVYVATFIFLPFWLVVQYALFYLGMINSVNLVTQCFSLIGGGLIGLNLKKYLGKELSAEDHIPGTDDLKERFDQAAKEVTNGNYDRAKTIYIELLAEYPANKDVHLALFNIVKLQPSSEEYHIVVRNIFLLHDMSNTTTAMINLVFNSYMKRAEPRVRFDNEMFLGLLQRFRKFGYLEDAATILKILSQKNEEGKLSERLAREQLMLARAFVSINKKERAEQLVQSLLETFPDTESAQHIHSKFEANEDPLS